MENFGNENIYKIVILEKNQRRLFHPRLHEQSSEGTMVHKKSSSTIKKCLFGKADPEDTKIMLEEQYIKDQQRFLERFGFDIETIEYLERSKDDIQSNIENDRNGHNVELRKTSSILGDLKTGSRRTLKARRKMNFCKPQASQRFITDFYKSRKSNNSLLEKMQPPVEQQSSTVSAHSCQN